MASESGAVSVSDAARRDRLARRHGLGAPHRHPDLAAATAAMTAWHATDPSTVHLAIHARTDGVGIAQVDEALHDSRTLVKQMAMRRTIFAVPRALHPFVVASAGARVARTVRTEMARVLRGAGVTDDPDGWLARMEQQVTTLLADGAARTTAEVSAALPELSRRIEHGAGRAWAGSRALTPMVLALLNAQGSVCRGANAAEWRRPMPTWTLPEAWLGEPLAPVEAREGYAALVAAWLQTFGPATEADAVWWLGATKTAVRQALADAGAVPVSLSGNRVGWVHPEDPMARGEGGDDDVDPWAALLPPLDPTTMGWRERDVYLDPAHVPYLFDSAGNGVATAWVDGRIVGSWVQDGAGRVQVVLLEDVPASRRGLLDVETERLEALLDGQVIGSPYTRRLAARQPLR